MKKWFKPKLLVMLPPVLAALIVLPFWWASGTAYAATESITSGTVPWNNTKGNGASVPFQMADISSVFSGTLVCPNMVQSVLNNGTPTVPTLQIWLIEDSHGGRLDASGETRCTHTQTNWSLSAGQNPAGHYHLWVNCHWGGCGNDVTVSYSVDTRTAAPANNTLTADQLLNQTLKNQTPKPAQAYAVHTGWATSASPGTGFFPSSSVQSKIAVDAVIACTNPAGTLRMSIKISPNSSLNPNKVLNSTTLSCQSGSGHTDDLSVHTDVGFIVTFDNAINTGNWAVKYVASADKPLPTPPSQSSCTDTSSCHTDPPPPCNTSSCHTDSGTTPIPLYRLWNPKTGYHFYTTSASERDAAEGKGGYTIREGVAAYVPSSQIANSTPLYRVLNPKTGDHFYTTSKEERNAAEGEGYTIDEGPVAYVFSSQIANSTPVFRVLNPKTGDHFYTTSKEERDAAVQRKGFTIDEGPVFYVYPTPVDNTPLYNLGNPNTGDHFYTTSASERDAVEGKGYTYLGIAAYVFSSQIASSKPLYRLWNKTTGDHLYTTSQEEINNATNNGGYTLEGPACYVYPTQVNNSTPLYRLWNKTTGYHFYTTSDYERIQMSSKGGYTYEGPAAYVQPA